jgi:ubiquinol-cytochrome c reductase cytochrome c1 subunit
MKRLLAVTLAAVSLTVGASEGQTPIQSVDIDVFDRDSVRRGAEFYVNYCQGCHSLKHIRYSRLAADYDIGDEIMQSNFLLGERKMHETLQSAMKQEDSERWFGAPAPDLSLAARARGANWIYSYLQGFYVDPSRPTGVNNLYLPNVAMPNVLGGLQGLQKPVISHEGGMEFVAHLELDKPGSMTPDQFDEALTDLMNFLVYVSEPSMLQRLPLGKYVLGFMVLLTYLLYRVKKEYWKDVH